MRASASGAAEQQQRAERELDSRSSQLRDTIQKHEAEVSPWMEMLGASGSHPLVVNRLSPGQLSVLELSFGKVQDNASLCPAVSVRTLPNH